MDRKYIAFISYRHLSLDMAVAKSLHKRIEHYQVPRDLRSEPSQKKLGIVFRDREELPLSNDLTQDIYTALDHSDYLIVVCTPDTPKSLWISREIEHFLQTHDRSRILTVLAAGTPEESIPHQITHIYGEDGRLIDRREPLCAYIVADRPWKVKLNLLREFPRLVAAILGKPLDAIRQRARAYRWRLTGGLMAIAMAISLGFIGMLASKNQEIKNQLMQALLNESKSLALISQNHLEDGNRIGALESALQALPSPGNERPYYAAAATALENALYLYEWPSYRAHATMTEPLGFNKLTITRDGKYAAGLIGSYKIVCYDLTTRQPIWECPWPDDYAAMSLEFLEEQGTILYTSCGGGQFVLDAQTGQLLHTCTLSLRIFPEDFTKDERYVALIDEAHVVFFDTQTGETIRSPAIDRGDYTWFSCGGYSADDKTFLMVYTGVFEGDRQLRYAIIDSHTGAILHNEQVLSGLSESPSSSCVIGLDDGSFFVSALYEDSRFFCRVGADGEILALNGYQLPENAPISVNVHDRIQLIGDSIWIVESNAYRSIDPKTCQITLMMSIFSDKYCQMFADGTLIFQRSNDQLYILQLGKDGHLASSKDLFFPWAFSSIYASVHNSDTFLIQGDDNTTLQIVTKQGLLGSEEANAEPLPITLSGNLIYLPDYCGIYCSPDSETVYFMDVDPSQDSWENNTHTLYHTATGQAETIAPPDIRQYTGLTAYDGPVPDVIGQTVHRSAISKNGKLAAFAGADGIIYLYNLDTQTLQAQSSDIAKICDSITFLRNDSIVLVGNRGLYSAIDTASGEIVGQFETETSPTGHDGYYTQIRESKDSSRLFICSSIAEFDGAIVETENWTVEHYVNGLVGYLPALDSLVYVSPDYTTVYFQKLPDTETLITLGNQAHPDR